MYGIKNKQMGFRKSERKRECNKVEVGIAWCMEWLIGQDGKQIGQLIQTEPYCGHAKQTHAYCLPLYNYNS